MNDLASRALFATPLHARTSELCATNNWTEQHGFTVPALYASPREEQEALTGRVGLSDLSARQCWTFEGPDAAAYLSFVTLTDVARLEAGQTAHTLWCDDAGFVRGEGVIARFAAAQFELSTGVRDFAWMMDGARGFDLKLTNVTGTKAVVGVKGPLAPSLLALAGMVGEGGGSGAAARPAWRPAQVALARDTTGDGLELSTSAEDGIVVWDRLWRVGAGLGIAAVGAAALEAHRIEKAVPRAGVDWRPSHLAREAADLRVPSDLGHAPDLTRRFNGADALRRTASQGRQVLAHISSEEPLSAGPLMARNVIVGRITSTAWSEAQATAFALAWLDADAVKPGTKLTPQGAQTARAEILRPVFGA